MRQRITQAAPPVVFHVAGLQNTLADVASRPAKGVASHFHLLETTPCAMCPNSFLSLFDSSYPLPQKLRWTNVQPPFDLWSSVILKLRGQQLPLRQWTTRLDQRPGKTGATTPEHRPLDATPFEALQANLLPCRFRKGSHWNLWQCKSSWPPNGGKGLASCGANLAFGRARRPSPYLRLQRA
jgi:hypothetical protein